MLVCGKFILTTEQLIVLVIFLLAYWIYSQQPQLKTTTQTQTELTAEQIAQMEKALTEQTTKITALTSTQTELTNQLTHKEVEINQLKEKTKDLEPNPVETRLIGIASGVDWNQDNWKNFLGPLETGADWNQLRTPYFQIRNNLLTYAKTALKQAELEVEIEKVVRVRQELQTKYDLEVRSKEELLEYLNIYRMSRYPEYFIKKSYDAETEQIRFRKFLKQHQSHRLFGLTIEKDEAESNKSLNPPLVFDMSDISCNPYFLVFEFLLDPDKKSFELRLPRHMNYSKFSIRDELEFGSEGLVPAVFRKMNEPKDIHTFLHSLPIAYNGRIFKDGKIIGQQKLSSKAPVLYKEGEEYEGKKLDHHKIVV